MTELEKLEKELLQEIQEESGIYANAEEFCTIDPETRTITVPLSKRILGTESDQETNRLYFKCPKVVGDNVDLSLFSLRINYQNAGNKKDQYLVEDVKEEGDNITFSWLLKRNVTAYKGNVKFILCAVKTTEDGIIKNEWNTTLNTECESLEGMEVDKVAVEEETKDIVEQLIAMMNHSAENAVRAVEEAKAEVDKEVGDFALKAQQALADVNNAGQAQTERVQTAGNDAVESIKAAQGTATEAVETAKSEAIQAVQTEGTTQAGNVSAEGEKQVQAVRGAAQEIIADREQIQENKAGIAKLKEDIVGLDNRKADAIVETASGTPLDITDSVKLPIQNLRIFGKSEQVQTTGAQLFNAREALKSQIEKGIVSFDSDGKIILNGKFDSNNRQFSITLQPGTYTLSGDDNGVWHILAPTDGVFRRKLVVDVETTYACYIASGTYNNHVTAPMINIGDTAKPYEPYTGCKPAPSPEYPQEIVNAGNNGTVDIKINSNNLISPFKEMTVNKLATVQYDTHKSDELVITRLDGVKQYDGIQTSLILQKGTYTFAYDSIEGEFLSGNITGIRNEDENDRTLISLNNSNYKRGSFTLDKKTNIKLVVFNGNTKAGLAKIKGLRISFLQEDNRWKPYEEQSLTFSTPNGLPGIKVDTGGNYTDTTGQQWITDEIDLARGKYVQRAYVLDVPPIIRAYGTETNNETTRFLIALTKKAKNSSYPCLCNVSKHERMWSADKEGVYADVDNLIFRMSKTLVGETEDSVKKYLESADIKVLYLLATPIETDLPPETIEAFKTLHTNYPTTVISNDENAGMEVSYVADTKHYIDKKFEELNQAIVNTQIALL